MSKYLSVDGVKLHYQEEGSGYPVLLLHGWGDNADVMRHRWEAEVPWPEGIRRVYLDLPGHGRSEAPIHIKCSDDILEYTHQFTRQLFSGNHFAVVGHSYGGYIAQGLIHKAADCVDGLCLLAPLVVAENEQRKVPAMEVIEDDRESYSLLPTDWLDLLDVVAIRNKITLGKISKRIQIGSSAPCNEDFLDAIRDDASRYSFSFDNRILSEPFLGPTLIITGRQDTVVGYEDMWGILDYYPESTFVLLHGTGHLLEAKEAEIGTHFKRWLKTLLG